MHDFVLQEIKHIYSSYDGWKIIPPMKGPGYDTPVLNERMNNGHRKIVKILVSFKKVVTLDLLEELTRPEPILDGMVPRYDFAVIVPAGADVSALPKDLKVFTMRSFAFDGKDLIWVKKPVRKAAEPEKNSVVADGRKGNIRRDDLAVPGWIRVARA